MGLAHGAIGWADVAVPDRETGKAFYTGLFGWEADDGDESMGYTMFTKHGKKVAGMAGLSPEQIAAGQPPVWTPYVIVDDAAAVHASAAELGAQILLEPMEILDAGTMLYLLDPTGAAIGFWQSGEHDGADVFNEIDTMTWNDLGCRDVASARDFYVQLLGWGTQDMEMGEGTYTVFTVDGRSNGGVWDISGVLPEDVPPHWLTWFRVADAAATAARATELGGSVMKEPASSPMGITAVIGDPGGAVFAIIETDQVDGQPPR